MTALEATTREQAMQRRFNRLASLWKSVQFDHLNISQGDILFRSLRSYSYAHQANENRSHRHITANRRFIDFWSGVLCIILVMK